MTNRFLGSRFIPLFGLAAAIVAAFGDKSIAQEAAVAYQDHLDLSYYLDAGSRKQPIQAIGDWQQRRRHILAGMQAVMGPLPEPAKVVPLNVKTIEEATVGAITRRKISFHTDSPDGVVSAYLFLPKTAGRKLPAVLCLHQTTHFGKAEPAGLKGNSDLHYALHLARRGYVTLAPDYPSMGEHRFDFDSEHGYASGTMKAIHDNIRSVDLLQSLEQVDRDRIGCIGHSLGGHNSMFTAAFEPRLRVIVSSCGFTRFGKDDMPSWTGKRYMPRIATVYGNDPRRVPFDFPEIVASFAPRPFLACAATGDRDFDVAGVKDTLAAARPIYQLYGKAHHLQAYYPDCSHAFPADARERAYKFLDQHLKPQ